MTNWPLTLIDGGAQRLCSSGHTFIVTVTFKHRNGTQIVVTCVCEVNQRIKRPLRLRFYSAAKSVFQRGMGLLRPRWSDQARRGGFNWLPRCPSGCIRTRVSACIGTMNADYLAKSFAFPRNIEDAARISPLGDLLRDGRWRRDLSIQCRLSRDTDRGRPTLKWAKTI